MRVDQYYGGNVPAELMIKRITRLNIDPPLSFSTCYFVVTSLHICPRCQLVFLSTEFVIIFNILFIHVDNGTRSILLLNARRYINEFTLKCLTLRIKTRRTLTLSRPLQRKRYRYVTPRVAKCEIYTIYRTENVNTQQILVNYLIKKRSPQTSVILSYLIR